MSNSRVMANMGTFENGVLWHNDFFGIATAVALTTAYPDVLALEGSDTAQAVLDVQTDTAEGTLRMTTGNDDSIAADLIGFTTGRIVRLDRNAPVIFEARFLNVTVITARNVFVGMTDTSAIEQPWTQVGTTFISTATDSVGFLYDTDATTGNWYAVGVDTNSDTITADTGIPPVLDVEQTFRLVITSDGSCSWWIGNQQVAHQANAISNDILLCGIVTAMSTTTTIASLDVDYATLRAQRRQP